jgi:predicted ArsR family transcriptional regulator
VIKDLDVDPKAVLDHMEHLQNEGVRQTVSALAWGLPVYTFEMGK